MADPLVGGNPLLGLPPASLSPPPPAPAAPATGVAPLGTQPLLPWTEPVTYTSARAAGDLSAALAAGCYRVGSREAARSNGVYAVGDVRFAVEQPVPGGLGEPKPRDRVSWGGRTYVVTEVTGSSWLGFWAVVGRCPAIAYDLREPLDVLRPAPEPGPGALRQATGGPAPLAAGVDGRLQVLDVRTEPDTDGKYVTRTRYAAYLAGEVAAAAGDVVRDAGGRLYPVVAQTAVHELGLLTTLECEVTG